jgi:hypothetical protein
MAAQRHTRIAYVLASVVGMRLSIEREAKKFPSEISLFVVTAKTFWKIETVNKAFLF